ncbi:MAG: ATP-binding cassette domain-containing protein [Saprospiraceae bacterium]|nr:ATP-binding cassette domain-containing protein [Saprospiraceae bacterium]
MAKAITESGDQPKPVFKKESFKEAIKIFEYIKPYKWSLIIGLILLTFTTGFFMVFPYLSGLMIDVAQGSAETDLTLGNIGWILALTLIVQGILAYSRVMLFAQVSERGIADVRKAVYDRMITLPIVFFEQNRVGDIVSRVTSDIEKLYSAFSITLAEFIRQILVLIIGVIFLGVTTPRLALIMLASFPVIVVGAMFFGRFIRKLSKQRQAELAETNTVLNETVQSIAAVKAFTNELFESIRYGKSIATMVTISLKYAKGRAIFAAFIVTVLFGSLFFVIWEGANMVSNGTITAGELVAFVAYTAILGGAIAGLGNFYTEIIGAIGATERIREILKMDTEVSVKANKSIEKVQLRGNIQYKNVHFNYPTRDDVPVLKGIDLDIRAGERVALVGSSGAGKSTIVQLLLQFYKINSGDIIVDGKSVYDYDLSAYRSNMAIVPQEVMLFGGTIRENILYGKPEATEEEVIEAAKQSNSWEFISTFPEALETIVGERGVKLSGGQRQRIAIARAILRDPSILILDEATSSLDASSEKVVQAALNTLMQNRTSIIIAHRLATIREVDRIYVMDQGMIIETGTHDELMQIENGFYRRLASLQYQTAGDLV